MNKEIITANKYQDSKPRLPEPGSELWTEYEPLYRELLPGDNFPIEALGEILAPAAKAIARCVQAPNAMAGQSVLGTANLAAQPHIDILVDGRRFPISEFFGTGAGSSDRKTTTDKAALRPVNEVAEELKQQYESEATDNENKLTIWKSEREKIIKKNITSEQKLTQIEELGAQPIVKPEPIFTLDDVTIEGLRCAFKEGRSALGIFTTEGAIFLNGWAMQPEQQLKTAATLSAAWDGAPIKLARGGEGLIILYGRRLSANLFTQPDILHALLSNTKLLRQGFLSRVLPAITTSIAGTRMYDENNVLDNEPAYRKYCSRITELMNLLPQVHEKSFALQPRVLIPDQEAKLLYVKFYNAIEKEMRIDGKLSDIRAFAGKIAEHALRLAGTRQFIESPQSGCISKESMIGGIELAQFYLNETLRLAAVGMVPPEIEAASQLWAWLKSKGKRLFCTVEIYDLGPNQLRSKKEAQAALDVLLDHNIVRPSRESVEYRGVIRRECWELRQDV
jgi:hypothetical protein